MHINQCACRQMLFANLLEIARAENLTLDQLIKQTGCGAQCGTCLPYLQRMMETGQTEFSEIIPFSATKTAALTLRRAPVRNEK